MKSILFTIAIVSFFCTKSPAQFIIQDGAMVTFKDSSLITLKDIDLINDGILLTNNGNKVIFSGNINNTISGSAGTTRFDTLEIAKADGKTLQLHSHLYINGAVICTSGVIDLNGKIIELAPEALLMNETELSNITSISGAGDIRITKLLNAPTADNPGNLGALITSGENMGNTTVSRSHFSSINNDGEIVSTVKRQFQIEPQYNDDLNATLGIHYLDNELNGLDEDNLLLAKSVAYPYISFTNEGFTIRSPTDNYIEKTGINDFSFWSIIDNSTALPVTLINFTTNCIGDGAVLKWITASAVNTDYFSIEESDDAQTWHTIGKVDFDNNNHNYNYSTASYKKYYRLKVVDKDAAFAYSEIVASDCKIKDVNIYLWPNPASDYLHLNINAIKNTEAGIRVYDAKGALVMAKLSQINPGNNAMTLDISGLSAGMYLVNIQMNEGQLNKTISFIRR